MPRPSKPPRLYLRRKRGYAPVWVILDSGREVRTGAGQAEREVAERALEAHLAAKRRETTGPRDPDQVMILDVLDAYQHDRAGKVRRLQNITNAVIRLVDFFGTATVGSLTPGRSGQYVEWRTQQQDGRGGTRTVSAATARLELEILRTAISWGWKNRRIDRPIPVSVPPRGEPRDRYLTRDEVARLLRAARKLGHRHLCRFILLGVYTGTRHTAILQLQWMRNTTGGWVDLDANVLYRRAEGAAETKKRRRPVPIPPRLLPHLRAWQRDGGRYLIEWHGQPMQALFRQSWGTAREIAGLGPEVVPHVLKHTCATWLLQGRPERRIPGASLQDVAGILGTTEAVVSHTYGHHAQTHLLRVLGAFSRRGA